MERNPQHKVFALSSINKRSQLKGKPDCSESIRFHITVLTFHFVASPFLRLLSKGHHIYIFTTGKCRVNGLRDYTPLLKAPNVCALNSFYTTLAYITDVEVKKT